MYVNVCVNLFKEFWKEKKNACCLEQELLTPYTYCLVSLTAVLREYRTNTKQKSQRGEKSFQESLFFYIIFKDHGKLAI